MSVKTTSIFILKITTNKIEMMLKCCSNPSELVICKWFRQELVVQTKDLVRKARSPPQKTTLGQTRNPILSPHVLGLGTSIKDVQFFCNFWRYIPTYLCPIHYHRDRKALFNNFPFFLNSAFSGLSARL